MSYASKRGRDDLAALTDTVNSPGGHDAIRIFLARQRAWIEMGAKMAAEIVAFGNPELMAAAYSRPYADMDKNDNLGDVAAFARRFACGAPRSAPADSVPAGSARTPARLSVPVLSGSQAQQKRENASGCAGAFRKFGRQQATAWTLIWFSTTALIWALAGAVVQHNLVRREMPTWAIYLSIYCGATVVSFLSILLTCWMRGI